MRMGRMKKGSLIAAFLLLWAMGTAALAARAELTLEAWTEPQAAEGPLEASYGWTLRNDSAYDIEDIYLYMDGRPLRYIEELETGESLSGSGVYALAQEDLGRRIPLRATGVAAVEQGAEAAETLLFTMASTSLAVQDMGVCAYAEIPRVPDFSLPERQAEGGKVSLYAHAYLEHRLVAAGEENRLYVFVHNEGSAAAKGIELRIGRENVAKLDALEPGAQACMEYAFTVEESESLSAKLYYRNEKDREKSVSLGSFQTLVRGGALRVQAQAEELAPRPGEEVPVRIEITNTGEERVKSIELFDGMGRELELPKTRLEAGESMQLECRVSFSAEEALVYTVSGRAKADCAAQSLPVLMAPAVPADTAGMKLFVNPDRTELGAQGADMVVFTCTLANTGGYDFHALRIRQDGRLVAADTRLAVGERKSYRFALKLDAAAELAFSAEAADATGAIHTQSATVQIADGPSGQEE